MSYTVLARRYRSGTFDEVIGQDHVAQTLKKAIASDRIAHAYLFCGTRGTGKTSMARILARALNCRAFDKPTVTPCGKCDSCVAVARGDDIDVIEIDAASNTGVDNVREVIENSQYRPARSRFKVYIIDEAHMLSKAAFNALLKTLEEPPSHVKFILATTEPEKLLPTILSRCQRYDFRNIPTREIAGHLAEICRRENVQADETALLLVAKAGAGSMRDALSLLDRLLSIGEKHLSVDLIEQLLGLPKSQLVFDLAGAIAAGDAKAVLIQADAIVQGGLSVDGLTAALVDHLRALLVIRACGPDTALVEAPGLSLEALAKQAESFDAGALAQDITILEELRRTLRQSQAGRALLDATLTRLAMADQFASIAQLLGAAVAANPATATAPVVQKKNSESLMPAAAPVSLASPAPAVSPKPATTIPQPAAHSASRVEPAAVSPEPVAAATPTATAIDEEDDDDALPAVGKVWSGPSESLATLMARSRVKSAEAAVTAVAEPVTSHPDSDPAASNPHADNADAQSLPSIWQSLLAALAEKAPMVQAVVAQGQLVAIEQDQLILRYEPRHETFVRQWERNGKKDLIRDAASKAAMRPVGVKFEIVARDDDGSGGGAVAASAPPVASRPPMRAKAPEPPAPAAVPEAPSIKVTAELVQSLASANPIVKQIMQRFGAQVIKVE